MREIVAHSSAQCLVSTVGRDGTGRNSRNLLDYKSIPWGGRQEGRGAPTYFQLGVQGSLEQEADNHSLTGGTFV